MPRWTHSTIYSFIHHVDVVPRCSINNTVKTVLAFQAGMTRWRSRPRSVSTYLSSADQRLEQDLPDYVDLTPDIDKHYLTLRNLGTLLLLYSVEAGAQYSSGSVFPSGHDVTVLV